MGKNPFGPRNMGEIFMKYFLFGLVVFLALVSTWRAIRLWKYTDDCSFPAVTINRATGERIWLWDRYKECEYKVIVSEELESEITATGLIHKDCTNVPVLEFEVVSDLNQVKEGKIGILKKETEYVIPSVSLYPHEEISIKLRTK